MPPNRRVTFSTARSAIGTRDDMTLRTANALRRHTGPERDLRQRRVAVARRRRRVGGARGRAARGGTLRLHRRRRRRRVDDAREPCGLRAPPAAAADAERPHRARPLGRGARDAFPVPVLPRAGRRPQHRARGRRDRSCARGSCSPRAVHPVDGGLTLDRGDRGGDGRRPAVVPALLGQRPRRGREPRRPRRGGGLQRDRRHARHARPGLAATRPAQRVPPVPRRRGDRAVHERPGLHQQAAGAGGRGPARRRRDDARDVPEPCAALGGPRRGCASSRRCRSSSRAC